MQTCVSYPCQIFFPWNADFFQLNADYIPIYWPCFQKIIIFTFYSVMLQDRNLHRILMIKKWTLLWKWAQPSIFNKNHDFFWHSYCDWCDLYWILYLGFCEISIPSYRTPMLKMKVNEKKQPFPIPLSICASTLFIHFHFWTRWEEQNGDSKS